ncbi:GntR family transcriptional regulator [Sphingopyxis sp. KK2]|uniref:GntR family transcriptional regulator n=1 Tax=Sphingopyxis sp. KK2 TaxID=1855727 RepID=UPI00097E6180|nr:winged helix-turn-helix domain-containing protein [Sphingopyxis sp. KK2]
MLYNWHIGLRDRIDRSRRDPLHFQIAHAIVHDIEHGRLAPGAWLPSSRYLAETLGFNRKAVVRAYERLIAQGWLTSLGTRGTAVAAALPCLSATSRLPDAGPCGVGYRFRKPRRDRATRGLASVAPGASSDIQRKDQQ